MRNIKLILLSVFIIVILAGAIYFIVFVYSVGKRFTDALNREYNRYDTIAREWDFTGTVYWSDSGHLYLRLDSSANVSMPMPMTYAPPFLLIKNDSILMLHRSGYPSLCAPIGAHVVKNKGNDSIVIGTQTIDLLP